MRWMSVCVCVLVCGRSVPDDEGVICRWIHDEIGFGKHLSTLLFDLHRPKRSERPIEQLVRRQRPCSPAIANRLNREIHEAAVPTKASAPASRSRSAKRREDELLVDQTLCVPLLYEESPLRLLSAH